MRQRCLNKNVKGFENYGGRGIKICSRWLKSYDNFLADMGEKPSKLHSIDRINNDGNYTPKNCRWTTKKIQANNTRSVKKYTIDGVSKTVKEWALHYKIKHKTIHKRLYAGWNYKDAITRPLRGTV
jgi:hypothetical protein